MRAVLFDLDGTLADTAADLSAALNRVRLKRGLEPVELEMLRPAASHGARGLIGVGFGFGPEHPDFAELRDDFMDCYEADIARHTRLFAGTEALLDALVQRNIPWGIVTNKVARFTLPLLEQLAMAHTPGVVVSGDTVGVAKPDPKPMLHAAAALGMEPTECLYIGDAARDIEAGRRVGMKTLVARYGYIGPDDEPETWGADGYIDHPLEVLRWL